MVPLANVFSKLSSSHSLSFPSPLSSSLRGAVTRPASSDSPCRRSSVVSRLKTAVYNDGDAQSSTLSSSWYLLPAEPPPPYQLRVANPATPRECLEGCTVDVGRRRTAAPSWSRFTNASVEAIRAPDSPVPVFPSPKLSTESVFGSTQSLASVSSGNGTTPPGPRGTRQNFGAEPVLRRRDTIRFPPRITLSSSYPSVPPTIRPL